MKKLLFAALTILASVLAFGSNAGAVTPFSFDSFEADYYLSRDADKTSHLKVDETLTARFASIGNDNHGIERALPLNYKFTDTAKTQSHSFDLQIDSVKGGPFSTRDQGDMRIIRIGDADSYVHGVRTYQISWSASNVTRNFDSGDEFYWDANGTGWSQRFDKVTARVHLPADLATQLDGRVRCEVGNMDSDADLGCETSATDTADGGKIFTFQSTSVAGVPAGQTLTFDIGFLAGTFAVPEFDIAVVTGVSANVFWGAVIGAIVATILAVFWLILVLKKYRPYKTRRSIVPEYLPPKHLSVIEAAIWWKRTNATKVFPAALIDLAVKHYVRIYEKEKKIKFGSSKDYGLQLLKLPDDKLPADERELLETIFDEKQVGADIDLKKLGRDTSKARQLQKVAPDAWKRLKKEKEFYRGSRGRINAFVVIFLAFWIIPFILTIFGVLFGSALLAPMFLPALIIAAVASILYNPISEKGATAKEYLKGLEMYMKVGEAERLKVLQSTEGAEKVRAELSMKEGSQEVMIVKLYERLMPYAVIFGITNDWAKALQVHYEADPSLVPAWYVGTNFAAFNAASFASAMNSFATSSYVSGAGSASSGGSGFSSGGGGFSGGGGGGGGGGGW